MCEHKGLVTCKMVRPAVLFLLLPLRHGLVIHNDESAAAVPKRGKFAYLTMAHDDEDTKGVNLLRTLPAVHSLRNVTSERIIVMTNATKFGDGTPVKPAFQKLGVEVWPILPVPIPEEFLRRKYSAKCKTRCGFTFFKLKAWSFTQFDKIIMFDTDAIVTKNFDELFQLPGTWAQEERWWCKPTGFMSGGFVILEPNEKHYEGLIKYANTQDIPAANQSTISGFFGMNSASGPMSAIIQGRFKAEFLEHKTAAPVRLMNSASVDYGMCLAHHHSPPAFVHKSDRNNHCFTIAESALSYECMHHPLGTFYRNNLCEALVKTGIKFDGMASYCN